MHKIDLNCDLGESFGNYKLGLDDEVIKYISSANIACGFHASDPLVMQKTVALARDNGVAVGAHPGFPDLVGFGRRNLAASPAEVKAMSTPLKSSLCFSSFTTIFLFRKTYSDPALREEPNNNNSSTGKFLSSNTRRNSWPTAPLAPTIATFISLFIYNLLNTVSFVRYFFIFQ